MESKKDNMGQFVAGGLTGFSSSDLETVENKISFTDRRPQLSPSTSAILEGLDDDSDDDDGTALRPSEKRSGRRKIKIEYIDDKSRRHITFSKRKAGIMKKVFLSFYSRHMNCPH